MSSHPDFVLCPQLTCVLHDNTIGYQRGDPLAQAMVEFLKANEEGREA